MHRDDSQLSAVEKRRFGRIDRYLGATALQITSQQKLDPAEVDSALLVVQFNGTVASS